MVFSKVINVKTIFILVFYLVLSLIIFNIKRIHQNETHAGTDNISVHSLQQTPMIAQQISYIGSVVIAEENEEGLFVTVENSGNLIPFLISHNTEVINEDLDILSIADIKFKSFIYITGTLDSEKLNIDQVVLVDKEEFEKQYPEATNGVGAIQLL